MDLIKSGSYVDIFYAKTCATTKIRTVAGYHVVLAMLFFMMLCCQRLLWLNRKFVGLGTHTQSFIWSVYIPQDWYQDCDNLLVMFNSSHAVRGLSRVRQYPPWLLFAAFVDSVGYPRYNPQKTRKQWRTRDRWFHWLWGWFPDLKIIFMM